MKRIWGIAIVFAISLLARSARADDADRAFQEALSLYDAGKVAEACVKFGESYALDPALGTLQNLAACHEREGKRALALREWLDLADRAQKAGKASPETLARQHVVELSTKLPRVLVRVDPKTGVEKVELDDAPFEVGKEIAVDPGRHRLTFSGSNRISATRNIDSLEGHSIELDAPALESAAGPAPELPVEPPKTTPAPPKKAPPWNPGWMLIGFGGVSAAIGTPFGIAAILERNASDEHCPNERCTQRGVDLNDRANAEAWVANIGIGLGIGLAAAGALFLVLKKPPPNATAWNSF